MDPNEPDYTENELHGPNHDCPECEAKRADIREEERIVAYEKRHAEDYRAEGEAEQKGFSSGRRELAQEIYRRELVREIKETEELEKMPSLTDAVIKSQAAFEAEQEDLAVEEMARDRAIKKALTEGAQPYTWSGPLAERVLAAPRPDRGDQITDQYEELAKAAVSAGDRIKTALRNPKLRFAHSGAQRAVLEIMRVASMLGHQLARFEDEQQACSACGQPVEHPDYTPVDMCTHCGDAMSRG